MNQRGFTLVELTLAMAIFSFMLALISVGVLQIGRIYQSGVYSRRTQETARNIMEDIAREVRSSTNIEVASANRLCMSNSSQVIEYTRDDSDFLRKTLATGSCSGLANAQTTNLIDPTAASGALRAQRFDASGINNQSGAIGSVEVSMIITTAAEDLLNTDQTACETARTGSHFCSSTSLVNTVSLRGVNNDN